ncbi:VanZ family protein [Xanthobacter wiegelii]|uniref:VanZ family protein n=1 Tax=Xanthobacter wiegelii TaxID=3119913 RepID=UPI00372A9714
MVHVISSSLDYHLHSTPFYLRNNGMPSCQRSSSCLINGIDRGTCTAKRDAYSAPMAYRIAAWLFVVALLVLSVVPAAERPVVIPEHDLEHAIAFVIAGALWAAAYPRSLVVTVLILVGFTAAIELIQMFVPTRHARFSDFVVDAVAISAGALIVATWRVTRRWMLAGRTG